MSGTHDGWASPSGGSAASPSVAVPSVPAAPALPSGGAPGGAVPAVGMPFDPDANYGLTGPPRPPAPPRQPGSRPAASSPVVTTAVGLCYTGVAIALAEVLIVVLAFAGVVSSEGGDLDGAAERLIVGFYVQLMVFAWLVPAAGVTLAATHARRGSNTARFLLVGLLAVLGLIRVCGLGQAVINPDTTTDLDQTFVVSISITSVVLGTMALVAAVLLLTPPARRHFEAVHRS